MTTLAASEPEVTRPGWVRCLGGWRYDFTAGWSGFVARTFGGQFSWTLLPWTRCQLIALNITTAGEAVSQDRRDPKEQAYATPDLAAEACERAREEM